MLVLLPPSEGKVAPLRGRPLDLTALSSPELRDARERVLDALVSLCAGDPRKAVDVLQLGPTQGDEVRRNAGLATAPAARADRVYGGVLYQALDLPSLDAAARRRATARLAVVSALFGLLRLGDRIPAYRLAGGVALPGVGPVARHWARHLGPAVLRAAGDGLVVDLRSSPYVPFWRPGGPGARRVVSVRVVRDDGGRRSVVSHDNKATKGRLVRSLLRSAGPAPRDVAALVHQLRDLGWQVEPRSDRPSALDVVVGEH